MSEFVAAGAVAEGPRRDRWGRPLIVPPGGGEAVPYTRVTTLAKTVSDMNGLMDWKARMVMIGVTKRPDLLARAAVLDPERDKKELNQVAAAAHEAAGGSVAAGMGTALHKASEYADLGQEIPPGLPVDVLYDLQAYRGEMNRLGIRVTHIEQFMVHDASRTAGTADRLCGVPGVSEFVIGDLKTGQDVKNYGGLEIAAQLAAYAASELYDVETGQRSRLPINQDFALVFHVPRGARACMVYQVDLSFGRVVLNLCTAVREARTNARKAMIEYERITA